MNKDVIYPSMVIRCQEETINKLEDEVNKQAKAIQIYEKELRKHDNNWNELKEWVENMIFNKVGSSVDVAIENHAYCKMLDKIEDIENDIK